MKNLFINKRTYIGNDGDEYINMFIPSVDMNTINANSFGLLNSTHNGRLDRFVYETVTRNVDDGLDLTLYVNHIYNPFAVQEGDVLYVPINDSKVFQKSSEPSLPDGKTFSSKQSGKKEMTYAEKVEYLALMGLGIG
ncbi:MAG: hypothetical protein NC548_39520 [Lachnospiraceae bacterium]|nr:hypothetical protein [Lachnospiraceae bacterium]